MLTCGNLPALILRAFTKDPKSQFSGTLGKTEHPRAKLQRIMSSSELQILHVGTELAQKGYI